MRTRFWGMAILLAVLSGVACGLPGRLAPFIAATATPTPTPTFTSTPTSTPTPIPVKSDVAVAQILLRYDSQQPLGTLEATLCNLGEEDFKGTLQVVFQANGRTYTVDVSPSQAQGLSSSRCIDVYPPVDFAFFGITQPGPVEVTVRIEGAPYGDPTENHLLRERIEIRYLETQPPAEALQRYQKCVEKFGQVYRYAPSFCLQRLPDFPMAEWNEIAKRRGVFTAIGPREQEGHFAAWVMALSTCTPEVQRFLGIPEGFQIPFIIARYDPEDSANVLAITFGATILLYEHEQDEDMDDLETDQMLIELMRIGCQPGQVIFTGAFEHELVHALLSLYIENEWHGFFMDYISEDGQVLLQGEDDLTNLLPGNLDEGLAYWVGGQFPPPHLTKTVWQCTDEGLMYTDLGVILPYFPLDLWRFSEFEAWLRRNLPADSPLREVYNNPGNLYLDLRYASAKCFWDTLVQMEGREVIGKVLAQLAAYPEEDTCLYPFVEVALAPVVRPETLKVLEERFNVRPGVDACDYE